MIGEDRKTRWEKVERSLRGEPSTADDDEAFEVARKLSRQGFYPARQIERAPAMAGWLARTQWRTEPMPAAAMEEELQAYLDSAAVDGRPLSREHVVRLLREFRHRQLMRIFLREIEGASLRQTTAEVSDLAQISLEIAFREAARFCGEPSAPAHLCAMGMGKLGGRELNFSSDVDLILAADDEFWSVDGGAAAERVSKEAVALIDEVTERGRVFRVDLRLRPEGSRGRLVPSESGLIDYYLTWGRTWERGAWLKARTVAGNQEIGCSRALRLSPTSRLRSHRRAAANEGDGRRRGEVRRFFSGPIRPGRHGRQGWGVVDGVQSF
jgi:[glutamine synthetase] adenylyltransferase / [glutamine synthetase]-adenylyl-L-tyrosine phosphorylase